MAKLILLLHFPLVWYKLPESKFSCNVDTANRKYERCQKTLFQITFVLSLVIRQFFSPLRVKENFFFSQGYFDCLRVEKAGCGLDITMFCPGPVDSNLLKVCFTEEKGKVSV